MYIVWIILEPKLHCFYTKIGKTVQQTISLFITENKDSQNENQYDSMLNIINKIEFEINLSQCIVIDIDMIIVLNI